MEDNNQTKKRKYGKITFYDAQKNELNDKKIIETIKRAAEDYENGEIVETASTLQKIVNELKEFINNN